MTNKESKAFLMGVTIINVVEESYTHQHESVSYQKTKNLRIGQINYSWNSDVSLGKTIILFMDLLHSC